MNKIDVEYIKKLWKLIESHSKTYPGDIDPYKWLYKIKGKTTTLKGTYDFINITECDRFVRLSLKKLTGKYYKIKLDNKINYICVFYVNFDNSWCGGHINIKIFNYLFESMDIKLKYNDMINLEYEEISTTKFEEISNLFK
jgi:hypothetical protein